MTKISPVEIMLSKTKLTGLSIVSIILVAVGFWLAIHPPVIRYPQTFYRPVIQLIGGVAVLFFGFTTFLIIRKLQDNTPGLVIDENGITDNSSAVSAGLILWRDIKDISVIEIGRQKLIMIEVYDPEKYINRQTHFLQKKAMQYNLKMYGTPISITANGLKCSFEELYQLIINSLQSYID